MQMAKSGMPPLCTEPMWDMMLSRHSPLFTPFSRTSRYLRRQI